MVIDLNARILARNDKGAERNRAWFMGREKLFVLESGQTTSNDGEWVKEAGAAVQINTGSGCHLDAEMVMRGLNALKP
jgi:hydrogenase nickel incorporation protein HypB